MDRPFTLPTGTSPADELVFGSDSHPTLGLVIADADFAAYAEGLPDERFAAFGPKNIVRPTSHRGLPRFRLRYTPGRHRLAATAA
jgi:hypothetical protein